MLLLLLLVMVIFVDTVNGLHCEPISEVLTDSDHHESALQSGGTAEGTSVLLARRQQGEQAVAGVGFVFYYYYHYLRFLHLTSLMSPMLGRWVTMMFMAVLTTCCRVLFY